MVIELPDLRQKNGWSCGPVAAAVVLQLFARPIPRQFPSSSPIDGTDPLALVPVFRRAGLHVLAGEMSAQDLRDQCKQGRPVVCLTQHAGQGHYVVVAGVERNRVYYQCPNDGPVSKPIGEFLRDWWDTGRDAKYSQFGISVWEL